MKKSLLTLFVLIVLALVAMPALAEGAPEAGDDEVTMLFMPGIADPFYYMMEKGIQSKAEELGVNLIVAEYPKSWGLEATAFCFNQIGTRNRVKASEVSRNSP